MSTPYLIPAGETRAEIEVINSRFIASLAPAGSVEEARSFITQIKHEFSDATHNVPAFVVGHGSSVITHCQDDGEPSGTAGRPALAVLQGSGLGDAVVVVTRYFGGTKLGTGGLVRAYGDAVRAVLEVTRRARRVEVAVAMLALPYPLFERVRLLGAAHRGEILEEDFGADVTITIQLTPENLESFQAALLELSSGSLQAEVIERREVLVPVEQSA
jgi:uncharacterized YigZ family protein